MDNEWKVTQHHLVLQFTPESCQFHELSTQWATCHNTCSYTVQPGWGRWLSQHLVHGWVNCYTSSKHSRLQTSSLPMLRLIPFCKGYMHREVFREQIVFCYLLIRMQDGLFVTNARMLKWTSASEIYVHASHFDWLSCYVRTCPLQGFSGSASGKFVSWYESITAFPSTIVITPTARILFIHP